MDCLQDGITSNCDRYGGVDSGAVTQFPPFQYLPAIVLTQLGISDANVYKAFSVISLVSFLAMLGFGGWAASRTGRPWTAPLFVLLLLTSPLLYYAWLTFGESLAAALILLAVVGALRRWPPGVIVLVTFGACITKKTAFPFVAVLMALALYATPIARRDLRRGHWIGVAAGIALGVAACAALNWLRYGQLTNKLYAQETGSRATGCASGSRVRCGRHPTAAPQSSGPWPRSSSWRSSRCSPSDWRARRD